MNQVATLPKRSLVDSMAAKYEMEPQAFMGAVKATCIKGDCSNEQFAAFLMVAKEYDLNPLTKEIYAFPDRGGITPIVSIDGWMNLINSHPEFDGMEFTDSMDDAGKLFSVECRMYRKDRQRPTSVIEYMSECARATDPWKKWPNRMLRHKAAIQCARYAFGFSGIMEPDEYERMRDVTPAAKPTVMERLRNQQEPTGEREGFDPSFVQSETDATLQGDVLDAETNTNTDDVSPASSVDADAAASASEAGDDPSPRQSPASNPIPKDVLVHFKDYARKALEIAGDQAMAVDDRLSKIETMLDNYRDVIPDDLWPQLTGMDIAFKAVVKGARTVERARSYIATDILECSETEIGGV
jgi:phage recombination protein Bet